jgi:hypothetical protein
MSNSFIAIPDRLAGIFFKQGYLISDEDKVYRNSCVFEMVSKGISAIDIELSAVSTIEMNPLQFKEILNSDSYRTAIINRGLSGSTANNLIGQSIRDSLLIKGRIDQAFNIISNASYKIR